MADTTLSLSPEQVATVLAALRHWQCSPAIDGINRATRFHELATNYFTLTPLDSDGIDALADQIAHAQSTAKPRLALSLDQMAQGNGHSRRDLQDAGLILAHVGRRGLAGWSHTMQALEGNNAAPHGLQDAAVLLHAVEHLYPVLPNNFGE